MTEHQVSDYTAGKIREIRKQRGWTTGDLALRCGLTDNMIENIESGRRDRAGSRRRDITVDELLVLARAFDVNPIDLIPGRTRLEPSEREQQIAALETELEHEEERRAVLDLQLRDIQIYHSETLEMIDRYRTQIDQLRQAT